jgi:hypothetical protein
MIGKKVRVFWPVDKSWYTGTVEEYDVSNGEHLLRYDDNDVEWVKIGENAGGPSGTTARTSSPQDSSAVQDIAPSLSPTRPLVESDRSDSSPSPHQPQLQPYDASHEAPYGVHGPPPHPYHPYPPNSGGLPAPQHPYPPMPNMGYSPYPPPYGGQPPPPYHHNVPPPPQPVPYGYPPVMPASGPPDRRPPESGASSTPGSGDKNSRKKAGPKVWTKEEDHLLLNMVQSMRMPMKWSIVAQQMVERTGKQCRERYVNHLNPRLKVADWNPVEDATIFHLYNTAGSHWAKMSKMIPGRTDNGIKNRFHNLRRQLEREDEHRLRLSKAEDFPEEIRLQSLRDFPEHLRGKNDDLWDIGRGIAVLAAQSVLGGGISRNAGRFGPFRTPENGDLCVRCGFIVPSVQTGHELCTKTGWCLSCTRIPPHISGPLLRECLNLRRCDDTELRQIVESWEDLFPLSVRPDGNEQAQTHEVKGDREELQAGE